MHTQKKSDMNDPFAIEGPHLEAPYNSLKRMRGNFLKIERQQGTGFHVGMGLAGQRRRLSKNIEAFVLLDSEG